MKKLTIIACFFSLLFSASAKDLDSTALIIIDIQEFYFPGGDMELSQPFKAAEKAALLLDYFRNNQGLVIHIRHNHEPGGKIHDMVKPLENEKIISKNEVNSFLNTGLESYLKEQNINNLVLCGMQTHMCLEGATRAAHDLGYNCTVVEDACTTRDLKYGTVTVKADDVHYSTLNTLKSYSKVITLDEFINFK